MTIGARSFWLVSSLTFGLLGCAWLRSGPSPSILPVERDQVPPPGLCRVWRVDSTTTRQDLPRDCKNIEYSAPPGAMVLYRPDDGSRRVVVCYMSVQERGVIEGVDVYNLDSERLLAIPQRSGDPPPDGGCANALSLVKNR